MTQKPTRSRRRQAVDRLYAARDLQAFDDADAPFRRPSANDSRYTPNEEEPAPMSGAAPSPYTPNEEPAQMDEEDWSGYTPNEDGAAGSAGEDSPYPPNQEEPAGEEALEDAPPVSPYARPSGEETAFDGPAFAPAPKMDLYAYAPAMRTEEPETLPDSGPGNVYRPREVTWADTQRREALDVSGYQVRDDAEPAVRKRRKKRLLKRGVIVAAVVVLAAALWLLRKPILGLFGGGGQSAPASVAADSASPAEAVKAYTAARGAEVTQSARNAISQLSGSLPMDVCIVTGDNVVTRSQRSDGLYDFYLFTNQGRLLCYFEGLSDMVLQADGAFYVNQSPWLVGSDGSALIRTASLESQLGAPLRLHPMQYGWATVENLADGTRNFLNRDGQLISSLWFSRLFPFTGAYTVGYVDTGSTADADQRYLLYVLGQDGQVLRWKNAAHTDDVVASACGMAYVNDGSLYRLPDVQTPVTVSAQVDAYPDCGALVLLDPETGKYGLFVDGAQHYACDYDAIRPMDSDLIWNQVSLGGFTIHAVQAGQYPMPLSYSFLLEKDGKVEYVALSAQEDYPILLEGEFEGGTNP